MSTTIGSLLLELRLDATTFNRDLNAAKRQAESVAKLFAGQTITPRVDHRELTRLNQHLTLKQQHWRQVQRDFAKPLKISVDFSQLDALEKRLKNLKAGSTTIGVNVSSTGQNQNQRGLAEEIGKAVARHSKGGSGIGGAISKAVSLPINIAIDTVGSVARGALEGVGRDISKDFAKGLSDGIKKELSYTIGSFDLIGNAIGQEIVKGIVDAFGRDIEIVEKTMKDVFGAATIATEGAAVRGQQSQTRQQRQRVAAQQAEREFEFTRENLGAIKERGARAQDLRVKLQQESAKLQEKIDKYLDKAGLQRLKTRSEAIFKQIEPLANQVGQMSQYQIPAGQRKSIQAQIEYYKKQLSKAQPGSDSASAFESEIAKLEKQESTLAAQVDAAEAELKKSNLSPKDAPKLTAQLNALRRERERLQDQMTAMEESARRIFQNQIDRLRGYDEKLLKEERTVARLAEPASNLELIQVPERFKSKRKSINQMRNPQSAAAQNVSSFYKQVFDEVTTRSGVVASDAQIPRLVAGNLPKGANAMYMRDSNTIAVSAQMLDAINQGKITQKQMETLVHESRHAVQAGFGAATGEDTRIGLLEASPQEARRLGRRIETSTSGGKGASEDFMRRTETDAYVFADRNAQEIFNKLQRQQVRQRLTQSVGVGGGRLEASFSQAQLKAMTNLQKISKLATVDIQEELRDAIADIEENAEDFRKLLDSALSDIDVLPVEEIEQLQEQLQNELESAINALGVSVERFMGEVENKPDKIKRQLDESLRQFNKKQIKTLADEYGVDSTGKKNAVIARLVNSADLKQLQPRVNEMTRARAQQQLARQEQIQRITQTAGRATAATGGAIRATGSAIQAVGRNPAMQALMSAGSDTAQSVLRVGAGLTAGMLAATQATYKLASGVESIALDLLPAGKMLKGVMQQTVVPAVAFTAATHMLPGGAMAAEGLSNLTHGALAPFAQSATGQLTGAAAEGLTALPQIMGIQSAVTSMVTGAIESVMSGATGMAAQAGAMILGGKAIQAGVGLPANVLARQVQKTQQAKALPAARASNEPLALPMAATNQAELVKVEAAQQNIQKAQQAAAQVQKTTKEVVKQAGQAAAKAAQAVEAVKQVVASVDVQGAIDRATQISQGFWGAYKSLGDAVKQGDVGKADALLSEIRENADRAKKEIAKMVVELGDDAKFGTELGSKLANRQAQISRAANRAETQVRKLKPNEVPTNAIEVDVAAEAQYAFEDIQETIKKYIDRLRNGVDAIDPEAAAQEAIAGIEQALNRFERTESRIESNYQESSANLAGTAETMMTPDDSLLGRIKTIIDSNLPGGIDGLTKKFGSLKGVAGLALGSLLGFSAIGFIGPTLLGIARSATTAAISFEQLSVQFDSALGTRGAEALEAVTQRALDMRVGINQARESYLQFGAAVRDTPMEGITDLASQALSQAAITRGLTPDQMQRAQIAITQMVGKGGPIQSEEVRGQLAEALPGSTAIFARALGMSQSEFSANLVQGNISGADAVPKFLAQLQAETSTGVDQSLNTTAAAITNLQNQTQLLQETLGKPLLPLQKLGLDALASGVQMTANYIDELVQLLGAAAIASMLQFAASTLKGVNAVGLFNAAVSLSGNLLKTMGGFLKQPANSLAGFTVGTFAAIEAIKIMGKAFGDSGGAAREFADSADQAFRKYAESQKVAQGGAEAFKGDTGESLLEDTIIGGIFGKKLTRRFERSFQEFYGMRTYGEKAAEDQYIARQDAIAASNRVLTGDGETQGIYGLLQSAKNGGGGLATLAKLNQQMRDIQTRRNTLQPGDDAGRATLAEEERKIRQQQTSIEGRVRGLSAQNAAAIESFKRMRDEAERMGDVQGAEELTRQIDVLTKAQDMFNKAISQSVKSVAQLEAQFNRIQGTLKENNQQTDIAAAGVKTAVANNAALTTGQREFALLNQSQDEFAQRIAANRQALSEMVATLNDVETQRVLNIAGFNNESSPSAIRERTATMADSPDKARLELAADQMEGIRGLQAESANLTAQMAESQQQARQRMIDLGKEIAAFYRQVGRDVQEMQRTVEGLNLEAEFTRTKTQIEASLGRFRNTFFDDLVSGVTGLVDILQEIAQIPLQAQGQIAGLKNQIQDNMLNATQMNQQLPGGNTTPFKGVIVTSAVDASGEPGLDYVVEDGKRGAQFGALAGGEVIETVTDQNWESRLEEGGTQRGYGNRVIVRTIDEVTGEFVDMLYAHLDQVAVQVGQRVGVGSVLGTQGRTGSTTGAHVSADFFGKDSNAATPAAINMRDRIARTLANNPDALNQQIQAAPAQPAQAVAAPAPMGQSLFAGGSRSLAARVVGVSEGTRTAEGGFTSAYAGHADPGNGRRNQGSFSYQQQAWSGEDADEKWNKQLESVFGGFVEAARKAGLDPNNPELAFNFLDLYTQSPAAATERGGFLDQMPAIAQGRSILDARVASYVNPNTGALDAPGFGNSEARLRADQERRMGAVRQGIQANNLQSGSNLSVNPANAALINQGITQFNNAANANIAAVNNNAAAQVEARIQQAAKFLESQGQQLNLNLRDVDTSVIEAQRRAREAQFNSVRQTPEVQQQRELFGLNNRLEDISRDLGIDKLERSLEALKKLEERYASLEVPPQLQDEADAYLKQIREAIPEVEQALESTRKAYEEESTALRETIKLKEEDFKISQERRRMEARQATTQMRGEIGTAQIDRARRRQYDFTGLREAATLEYQMGVDQLNSNIEAKRANLEEQLRMAGADEELTAELEKQLELLDQLKNVSLQNLQDQFTQSSSAVQMSQLDLDRRIFDSGAAVLQEQSSGLRAMGLTTQADRLDKQVAIGQAGMDLTRSLLEYDQLAATTGMAAEQVQILKDNAIALSQVRMENINNQFSAMGQLMPRIQGAFGGFFTSIITGSESIEDAFKNMLMNLANSLAQFGVNMLMNELFGGLMGMGGSPMGQMGMGGPMGGGMGGGILGIASTLLSGAFGGGGMAMGFGSGVMGAAGGMMSLFSDGGEVGKTGKTARSIEDAMRMEGPKAELIVASRGELILPIDKTREFYARGLDRVLNFKEGGMVGGGGRPAVSPAFKEGGNNNVSISISMGKDGQQQTDRRGAGKLATQIEGAVLEILTRERRPGGLLT